jgi:hypothetical protein
MRPKARVLALIAVLSILAWGGRDRRDLYRYGGLKWRSVPLSLAGAVKLHAGSVQLLVYSICHYSKRLMPSLWSSLSISVQ